MTEDTDTEKNFFDLLAYDACGEQHRTRPYKFMWGVFIMYIASGGIQTLPDPVFLPFGLLFLLVWFGAPIAVYYDSKYVAEQTEWNLTQPLWILGVFIPGYLGVGIVLYYLYGRNKALHTAGN